jgi:hypothetical protein
MPTDVVPPRVVLDGVPRVGFYSGDRCPEDVPFPSCLRAYLEYIGDNAGCKHVAPHDPTHRWGCLNAYLMGTSGAAWRLLWKPGWHGDNADLLVMAEDTMAPFRRAFDSVGLAFEVVLVGPGGQGADVLRERIVESIRDRRRPVIAFGVIGPPECCLVTGYDEGGDVLIGWNYFQGMCDFSAGVDFEPSGYFRKRTWYPDTRGLLLIGDRQEVPDRSVVYRDSLKWALEVLRTPEVNGRHNGLAAYQAWADHLLRDCDFPADDMAALNDRYMAHFDATCTVAEGRWYGAQFLEQVARDQPAMCESLMAAAGCFRKEHDLMWRVWDLAGGNGWTPAQVRKLAEPEVRRAIVPVLMASLAQDLEAAAHIEAALAARA